MNLVEGRWKPNQDDLDHIKNFVLEQYQYSRDDFERHYGRDWLIYYQHYKNVVEEQLDPDSLHTSIGVGAAFPIIKTMSALMMTPWQAGDRIFNALAYDAAGVPAEAKVAAYLNDEVINRQMHMFSKLELVKEASLLFGRGALKYYDRWQRPKSVLQRVADNVMGIFMGSSARMVPQPAHAIHTFDYVDPFNFHWVGGNRFGDDVDFTFELQHITDHEAWRRVEAGEWLKGVTPDEGTAIGYDQFTQRRHMLDTVSSDFVYARQGRTFRPHQIVEAQGWIETKEKKNGHPVYRNLLVQILDGQDVAVVEPLQTWDAKPSYIVLQPQNDVAGDRPMSVIEVSEYLILALNEFVNIGLDNARMIIESPLAIDPLSVDHPDAFNIGLGPAEINWIRNPGQSIHPLNMKDLPRSYYQMVGYFNDLMQKITGVSDYFGGLNTADTDRVTQTARGMALMTQNAAKRFAPFLKKQDLELYRPLARCIHETGRLRMEGEVPIRMPGPAAGAGMEQMQQRNTVSPFATITARDLDFPMNYAFTTTAMDAATGQKKIEFLQMIDRLNQMAAGGSLGAQGKYLDAFEMARMVMEQFGHGEDVERIIKDMDPMMRKAMLLGAGGPQEQLGAGGDPGRPAPPQGLQDLGAA